MVRESAQVGGRSPRAGERSGEGLPLPGGARGGLGSAPAAAPPAPRGVRESRVPPHDLQAESACLSAVMVDAAAMAKVRPWLEPSHFYSEAHARMFEACCSLALRGVPLCGVSVATELRYRGRLGQAGGVAYVTEVLNSAPAVAHVASYGRTVRDLAAVRDAMTVAARILAMGYAGEIGSPQAFAARALAALAAAVAPLGPPAAAGLPAWLEPTRHTSGSPS
jgi:hypothetical protein